MTARLKALADMEQSSVIDVLVTVDIVEQRPFRPGHERRFAADRPERPRRAVHPAGDDAIGAEEGVVAPGKRELGLRGGGSLGVMVFRGDA